MLSGFEASACTTSRFKAQRFQVHGSGLSCGGGFDPKP